ncbi:hypothetical protein B0H19DRAFT_202399 [Mycena capillaripes]|nr:hypothetical protein B0H19DRAFT_202399 [Mycena capillaripes]
MSTLTIYSLPNELLEAIAAAGQEGRVPDFQGALKSEWTLSHISRRFREVVVSAPALWTLIGANLAAEGSVEILKIYLERSGGCKICAALLLPSYADLHDIRATEESVRLVVPHIHRIRRLRVVLMTAWGRQLLGPFRDIAAPNLQHLEIVKKGSPVKSSPLELFSSGAPKLTFFKMDCFVPNPVPTWVASLTHLEFWGQCSVGTNLVKITALCTSLVHFYLDLTKSYTPNSQFRIPSLKFLHLSISDDLNLLYLLDIFDTPAVTEIKIDGTHGDEISALFSSPAFPCASFAALTTFSFSTTNRCAHRTKVTRTSPPLWLFPALSSLTLIKQCFMRNLVDDLLGQPWPLLKTVTLYPIESDVEEVHDALLTAIRTKHQRGEPLPTLRLSPSLFSVEAWRDTGAGVEMFDPPDLRS